MNLDLVRKMQMGVCPLKVPGGKRPQLTSKLPFTIVRITQAFTTISLRTYIIDRSYLSSRKGSQMKGTTNSFIISHTSSFGIADNPRHPFVFMENCIHLRLSFRRTVNSKNPHLNPGAI